MFDVIIVGAGPAGVSSAFALKHKKVAIVDVGHVQQKQQSSDVFSSLIGSDFSGVENIQNRSISPKLRAPDMRFITQAPSIPEAKVNSENFYPTLSYARGGLSNAWGAGVFEFNDEDLKDFPYKAQDLRPYYKILSEHIGISGTNEDDLASVWGGESKLLPPLNISPMSQQLLEKYQSNKNQFHKNGFLLGRPRLAILTEKYNGREPFNYDNTEFYKPNNSAIYHAGYTLNELIAHDQISYISQSFVTHFEESSECVIIYIKNTQTGEHSQLKCKKLILAAGALQSGALVLRSFQDESSQLPVLDNAVSFLPIIFPDLLGTCAQRNFYGGAELNIHWQSEDMSPVQASFYTLTGVMRSDLVREFPFVWSGNLWATQYLSPAIGVAQVFYPDSINKRNTLSLGPEGQLRIRYQVHGRTDVEKKLSQSLRNVGLIAFSFLSKRPPAGSSIHYAGTLPMSDFSKYQTSANGKLLNTNNVYVSDAATFPSLPSKNLTLTIMANAMRIADNLFKQ